ncbi:MAG: calcium/sodium antiporter [Gammaproteobacteria bacterium]|nr:calcium/sodium antiporter [Gammaproteobacteria bacterium]MCH2351403.1 calcium/sodium antiporter [Pseudomonadales bacterium]HAO56212.1 calcium/sodium antiporter [Gammaproteobacteria bacterium]
MLLSIFGLIVGLIALVWSADRFVTYAAITASNFGVSRMVIGLTVVSVGTSAPEIFVGVIASIDGSPTLAIGNAIGSNIANIGLVLGITALITPLPFPGAILKREVPWLVLTTLLALVCLANLYLSSIDGIMLLCGLGLILYKLAKPGKQAGGIAPSYENELDDLPTLSTSSGLWRLLLSLVLLLTAAEILTKSAVFIAYQLGVSEIIVGLTVIAIGTSLPELAASVTAAKKGQSDMAIGNVVGSNILNILAVLAVPALIHPINIDAIVILRDYMTMLVLTVILVFFAYAVGSQKKITRLEGCILLAAWVGYNSVLYHQV